MSGLYKRLDYLDQIKGFAIILVVMGHLILFAIGHKSPITAWLAYFHMPLFAFVSGFLFDNRIKPSKIAIKVKNLLVPFFLIGIVYTYVCCREGWKDFAFHYYKEGYWYLLSLAMLYIVCPIVRMDWVNSIRCRAMSELVLSCIIYFALNRVMGGGKSKVLAAIFLSAIYVYISLFCCWCVCKQV